jgi:hypothetical protein
MLQVADAPGMAPNRHQRRALHRAGYYDRPNGVAHAELTDKAHTLLKDILQGNSNVLSPEHAAALFALVALFTKSAQHKLPGRWAFGLPTGMGKTSAIVAWCSTLVRQGLDHISVAVSASKIEALCELKRQMIAHGVPAERIGLLYAESGRYSEPRTEDNDDRQIMLIAHARVKSKTGLALFNTYRGKPRDLLIYDESLVTSEAKGVTVRDLRGAIGYLRGRYGDLAPYVPMVTYLEQVQRCIEDALTTARATPNEAAMVTVPPLEDDDLEEFRQRLPVNPVVAPAALLLDLLREDLRAIATDEGGAVWYEVSVPRELRNIIILDASYPIRQLVRADRTIRDAEQHMPEIKRIGVPLSQLKSFENVMLHQMFAASG